MTGHSLALILRQHFRNNENDVRVNVEVCRVERADCSRRSGLKNSDEAVGLFSSDLKISCCTAVTEQQNTLCCLMGRTITFAACMHCRYNPTVYLLHHERNIKFSFLRLSKELFYIIEALHTMNKKTPVVSFNADK